VEATGLIEPEGSWGEQAARELCEKGGRTSGIGTWWVRREAKEARMRALRACCEVGEVV
jgi:hypothetical protein